MSTTTIKINTKSLLKALQLHKPIIQSEHKSSYDYVHVGVTNQKMTILGRAFSEFTALETDVSCTQANACAGFDTAAMVQYSSLLNGVRAYADFEFIFLTVDSAAGIGLSTNYPSATPGYTCTVQEKADITLPSLGEDAVSMTFAGKDLHKALSLTAPFVSKGAARYSLNGVYFGPGKKENTVDIVGSDTHRLGLYTATPLEAFNLNQSRGGKADLLIVGKALAYLTKHVKHADRVTITFGDAHGIVETLDWRIHFSLIEGRFPCYQDVVPDYNGMPGKLTINRDAAISAIQAVKPFTGDSGGVMLRPTVDGEHLLIEAYEEKTCIVSRTLPAAALKCPDVVINAQFLIDTLKTSDNDVVEIRFGRGGHSDPLMLFAGNYQHVLMPICNNYTDGSFPGADKERYEAAIKKDDQKATEVAASTLPKPLAVVRRPSFAAVVKHATADSKYRQELLEALGIPA